MKDTAVHNRRGSKMTDEEKHRIVTALNQQYRTTLPVGVMEVAVSAGFTTWSALKAEALAWQTPGSLSSPVIEQEETKK